MPLPSPFDLRMPIMFQITTVVCMGYWASFGIQVSDIHVGILKWGVEAKLHLLLKFEG